MILGASGSVEGGTGWYLVALGQSRAVLVASEVCFQKIYGLHGLNHTGLVEGGTGCYLVVLGKNRAVLVASVICFHKINGLHSGNHQIIQYSEKEEVITDRQTDKSTDRISYLRLDPFCGRGRNLYQMMMM